jgi:ribonuclease HI
MENQFMIIHTDGGARGNPGPAACAFVVEDGGKVVYKSSKYLGVATNNVAEYQGVISALDWLIQSPEQTFYNRKILFCLDSELVVRQLNGQYKVKNENLKSLFLEIDKKLRKIETKIIFQSVPRDKNKIADFLLNQELDKKVGGR